MNKIWRVKSQACILDDTRAASAELASSVEKATDNCLNLCIGSLGISEIAIESVTTTVHPLGAGVSFVIVTMIASKEVDR
jgi:hypothetical protein